MWKWMAWFGEVGTRTIHEFYSEEGFQSFEEARQDFITHLNSGTFERQMPENVVLLDVQIVMEADNG